MQYVIVYVMYDVVSYAIASTIAQILPPQAKSLHTVLTMNVDILFKLCLANNRCIICLNSYTS